MRISGGCHCGQIRFRADIAPDRTRICHCSDCQRLSGSPFRVVVPVDEADFELLSGTLKAYLKTGASGAKRQQVFCPDCGTPIYATSNDEGPRKLGLRVGAIDQADQLVPKRQYWAKSAAGWLADIPGIKSFETQ